MQLIIESSDEKVLQAILELIRPFNVTFKEVRKESTISVKETKETPQRPKATRKLGIIPGLVAYMAPDFNAPLEDFARHPVSVFKSK